MRGSRSTCPPSHQLTAANAAGCSVFMRAVVPLTATIATENPGEYSSMWPMGLQHPKFFVAVARLNRSRVVAGSPLAGDVQLTAVLVHCGEFLALALAHVACGVWRVACGIHFGGQI